MFNALISACGQSGAVDRAFDVLAEMRAEATPVDPDHVTIGALLKTCTQVGQVRCVYSNTLNIVLVFALSTLCSCSYNQDHIFYV